MIISRGRRYIFVHIPKTGGTSMAMALEARAMADDIMLGDTPKAVKRRRKLKGAEARGRLWKHSTLADIDGIITPAEAAEFLVFTLVRNPWDRAVSYYHWLRDQRFAHPAVALACELSFGDFICHDQTCDSFRAWPARRYVTDASGVERGVFLRLEHLATDVVPVENHLGFALEIPRTNASDRTDDWRAYYDDRSRAALSQACAEDIERFGYTFDP